MEQEFVEKRHTITKSELVDLTAAGRSLPGIMIANISMLFGYQTAGVLGGICCVVGITAPAVIILSLVTLVYESLKHFYWYQNALRGISCAVIAIIGSSLISLGKETLKDRLSFLICGIAFILCIFTGVSSIFLILTGVVLALLKAGGGKHGIH